MNPVHLPRSSRISHLDDLLSLNEEIYQNLKLKLQGINRSDEQIFRNIHKINSYCESGYGSEAESSAILMERALKDLKEEHYQARVLDRMEEELARQKRDMMYEQEQALVWDQGRDEQRVVPSRQRTVERSPQRIVQKYQQHMFQKQPQKYYNEQPPQQSQPDSQHNYPFPNDVEMTFQADAEELLIRKQNEVIVNRMAKGKVKTNAIYVAPLLNLNIDSQNTSIKIEPKQSMLTVKNETPNGKVKVDSTPLPRNINHVKPISSKSDKVYSQGDGCNSEQLGNHRQEDDRRSINSEQSKRKIDNHNRIFSKRKGEVGMMVSQKKIEERNRIIERPVEEAMDSARQGKVEKEVKVSRIITSDVGAQTERDKTKANGEAQTDRESQIEREPAQAESTLPKSGFYETILKSPRSFSKGSRRVPLCILFVPFNKLYRSPILQLKGSNKITLQRRSRPSVLPNSERSRIIDGIKYRFDHIVTDEQKLLQALFRAPKDSFLETINIEDSCVNGIRQSNPKRLQNTHQTQQDNSNTFSQPQPYNNRIAILGSEDTLKRKLHMGLLANSFTELSSRITNFKVQLVCNIEHQEMSSAQGDKIEPVHYENSFEIGANGDRVGLLKLEKSLQEVYRNMLNSPSCSRPAQSRFLRCTKILMYSPKHLQWSLDVISSNRYDTGFLKCLKVDRICWTINPLIKHYQEVHNTLESMRNYVRDD